MHSVQQLYQTRLAQSTRPFRARGAKVVRCEKCRLSRQACICEFAPDIDVAAAFLIIMYDDEILKPSNTARLINDVVADTTAVIWSRAQVDECITALLGHKDYFPMVVFPAEYAAPEQQIITQAPVFSQDKKPLFVLLDGSWREARKMYRKSSYLHQLPLLSFNFDDKAQTGSSRYHVRKTANTSHLATAEVAACALQSAGLNRGADILNAWFDVFSYRYQTSVCQPNQGDPDALSRYQAISAQQKRGVASGGE